MACPCDPPGWRDETASPQAWPSSRRLTMAAPANAGSARSRSASASSREKRGDGCAPSDDLEDGDDCRRFVSRAAATARREALTGAIATRTTAEHSVQLGFGESASLQAKR